MTPGELRTALVRVGEAVRDDVLAACRAQSVDELAAYDDSGEGDTAFAVDRVSEQRLLELAVGHDRWACDLRPLLGTARAGICAHPYDLAGWLVAAEAGVRVVAPDGSPLDAPLDLTSDVAWAAYANDAVRALVEPALQAVLVERGHL